MRRSNLANQDAPGRISVAVHPIGPTAAAKCETKPIVASTHLRLSFLLKPGRRIARGWGVGARCFLQTHCP